MLAAVSYLNYESFVRQKRQQSVQLSRGSLRDFKHFKEGWTSQD
jgi:hypothetical protein